MTAAPAATPPDPDAYRLPDAGPTLDQVRERDQWQDYVSNSLAVAQSSADKWRTGLAAFITLVTGGLLIKGPESAADLTTGWRIWLTILLGGGLAVGVAGLWAALRAASGNVEQTNLAAVIDRYGSLDAMQVAQAKSTVRALRLARYLVAVSLVLLGAGVLSWWWAKAPAADPPAYLKVTTSTSTACGRLASADGGYVRLAVSGAHDPLAVRLTSIVNMHVVASCSSP